MSANILVVEDDIAFAKMLQTYLNRRSFNVDVSHTGEAARELLTTNSYDLLLADLQLPDATGIEILDYAGKHAPQTQVIIITGHADVTTAVEAIKKGAIDYISKPFRPEELMMIIEEASSNDGAAPVSPVIPQIQDSLPTTTIDNKSVIGISMASKKLNDYIKLVGPTDMCVLIQGESGTGKEVAAKAIHEFSARRNRNFVPVDCGAIPKEIASSEFFGHIKGSFTGAINDKKGHFEAAHGGTLFLDEVGNLSYENQVQLLRALQERKIKPVGSNTEIEVDVRIITATNEDLIQAVETGDFREDLYHRLNEFSIQLPPLRERQEDLFLFIEYFLKEANESLNKNVIGLAPQVELAFKRYNWPGNLRELRNVIKRSVLLAEVDLIQLEDIPREVVNFKGDTGPSKDFSKDTNEKELIISALKEARFNKSQAAKLLNITRKTLYNKIDYYDIKL